METQLDIYWSSTAFAVVLLACDAAIGATVEEDFATLAKQLQGEKPAFSERQQKLLTERYDFADRSRPSSFCLTVDPFRIELRTKAPIGRYDGGADNEQDFR